MRVVLLGPPGAGKGTQAALISEKLGISRVSSGDLFREHQQRGSELGQLVGSYMKRGVLVPDSVTVAMVEDWIKENAHDGGFLLDGFPRTLPQAKFLKRVVSKIGGIDRGLYINVSHKELVRRLAGRVVCRSCRLPFHCDDVSAGVFGECEECGGELYQRDDDSADAVSKRIQVYLGETEPVVEYYRKSGVLREVDGEGTVNQVWSLLFEALRS